MIVYIFKKILYTLFVLWGVLSFVFFLFNILPGDPARMMLDKREDSEQLLIIQKKYAFDRSVSEQYLLYLNDLLPISLHHNHQESFTSLSNTKYTYFTLVDLMEYTIVVKIPYLRESFVRTGTKVSTIISQTFLNTFILAITSIITALLIGLIFGILSAINKDTLFDRMILIITSLGMSLPSFFASIIIAWLFGFLLHHHTGLNMTGSLYEVDDYGRGFFLEIKNLILPAFTLAIRPIAVIVQLCRNSLLEVLSMDYIRTARSKGLNKISVIFIHALRNALNPVLTAVSGWFASLLAGAVFVEYVFAWNGIGKEMVDALNKMDLPVVMGIVLFISVLFVIINIIVDIIYGFLDPRIRIN